MRKTLALALLAACADPSSTAPTVVARSTDSRGLPRMIEIRDAERGTAIEHVERLASTWRVKPLDMPVLDEIGDVKIPGGTVTRVRQTIDGLPVWGGELRVLVRDSGELQTIAGTLVGRDRPRTRTFALDRDAAVASAARGARVDRALARQVWYPSGAGLIAAWAVDAYTSVPGSAAGDATRTILAGDDGRVLERYSLVDDAAFDYKVYAETTGELHPLDGPQVDASPHPTGRPDGSYPAYLAGPPTITVDSITAFGVSDPWLSAGATETAGNNVNAYVDVNAPDGLSTGDFRATVTAPGVFGHVYDTALAPMATQEQQMAGITSLFYIINWLHDFWYAAGFTETAGNAQLSNYGRGGVEGDPVLAEAQDNALGGSRNNANMSTPDDGMSPRMQVYLWSGKDTHSLTLQPNGQTSRTPAIGTAAFGPKDFDVTGETIVGIDGAGANPTDGCEPLTNTVAGKIVVVDRGNCTFRRKTLNAQNVGAIGVIIVNNVASATPPPLGDDSMITTAITIPAVSLTDTEGAALEADITAGSVTATVHRSVGVDLDGSLDSTLIAHEFGHYLHHRLTLCGNAMCRAMSEGWGDFDALMLMARPGDNLMGAYPFSVYVTQGFTADPGYFGIRRAPYSADFSINSLSFRHMADHEPLPTDVPFLPSSSNSEVHNAGEVWAAALWQCYVALQNAGTSFDAVRTKMAKYVVAGLAMTPTEASPMEARDALLAAAYASSPEDHALMLSAFASRGFGSCAVPPPQASTDFTGLVESTIIAGNPEVTVTKLDDDCDHDGVLDSGETAHVHLQVANRGHATLSNVTLRVTSTDPGITVSSAPVSMPALEPEATTDLDVDVALASGRTDTVAAELALEVTADGGCQQTMAFPIAQRFNVDDAPATATTDTFDALESVWTPWSAAWTHVRTTALDGRWHGDDLATQSDTRLTSPYLHGSADEPVTLTFSHRYSFENSDNIPYDGGVIEYSIGADEVWHDIADIAVSVPYPTMLQADTGNPLAERRAFTGQSAAYPDMETVTLDLGASLADQTFRIRFRIGTDTGTSAPGWDIDNVAFTGIVGTPFPSEVGDDGACGPATPGDDEPIKSGGGGCCDASDTHVASNGLLSLGLAALLWRRRRRR